MKILILINPQNEFIAGKFGNPETLKIPGNICQLIQEYQEETIILVMETDRKQEMIEGEIEWVPFLPIRKALEGIPYILCRKQTYGCRELLKVLQEKQEKGDMPEILLAGVFTDKDVLANAMLLKTFFPNMKMQVASSACAGTSPERHRVAVEIIQELEDIT